MPVRCEPAGHLHTHADDEVLVTTIHQAKGREWDVVIVGSLNGPDLETDRVGGTLAEYIEEVAPANQAELAGEFDRARRHYVAFTRARRLLVLTATGEPHARIQRHLDGRRALARPGQGRPGAAAGSGRLRRPPPRM